MGAAPALLTVKDLGVTFQTRNQQGMTMAIRGGAVT